MNKIKLLFIALILLMVVGGCKKRTTTPIPAANSSVATSTNSVNSFTGNIDGVAYTYKEGVNDVEGSSISNKSLNAGSTSSGIFGTTLDYSTTDDGIMSINKGTIYFTDSSPDNAAFKSFFSTGTYLYSLHGANGVEVNWTDANGVDWSTSYGTGDQTGSTFSIQTSQVAATINDYYIKVTLKFSCKLYNTSGQSKTLTNGVYVGEFGNI